MYISGLCQVCRSFHTPLAFSLVGVFILFFQREKGRLPDVDYFRNVNCELGLELECRPLFLVIPVMLRIFWAFGSENFLLKESAGGLERAAYPPWAGHGSFSSWITAFSLSKVLLHPPDSEHSKN